VVDSFAAFPMLDLLVRAPKAARYVAGFTGQL
jgi:hypothetical protein